MRVRACFIFITIGIRVGLTAEKKARATKLFRKLDVDHNDRIPSGALYSALSQLDRSLTEDQLNYAASHHKTISLKDFLSLYSRLEHGHSGACACLCLLQNLATDLQD